MPNEYLFESVEAYKRGRFDLIGYYDKFIDKEVRLHKKQLKAFELLSDNDTKFVGYGGAARGGKSQLLCLFAILKAYAYPGTRYLIGRYELSNLMKTTWETMMRTFGNFDFVESDYNHNQQKNILRFHSVGSQFLLFDTRFKPSDPLLTRFGSLEITDALIDESNETPYNVIEMISARVGTMKNYTYGIKGKVLECHNPAKNHVRSRFWIPFRDDRESDNRKFVQALPSDNPSPEAQQWVEDKKKDYRNGDMSESEYNRLVNGDYDYDDDPAVMCEHDALCDLFHNSHVSGEEKYMTVDAALHGSDKFKIGVWEGFVMIDRLVMAKSDGREIVDAITNMKQKHGVPNSHILFDADGVGGFIDGFIRGAKPFHNGSRALNGENYENLITQCEYKAAKRINGRGYWLKCIVNQSDQEDIKEELGQLKKRDEDKDGKLKTLKKETVKQNLGRSPDDKDIIVMREYFELKKNIKARPRRIRQIRTT